MILSEMWGQHVRLGNFLWKYAYNIKLCSKFGYEAQYPDYYLWKYLENPPVVFDKEPHVDLLVRPKQWAWSQEEMDEIESLDFKNQNISFALNHFMQSYKWFEGYEKEVYNSLKIKQEEIEKVKDKYSYLFNSPESTIGISIRLGDFVGHGDFFQIPPEWYIKALNQEFPNWKTDYQVVVFSDDIPKAKQLFKDYSFYYTDFNDTASHRENFKYYHGDASEQFFLGIMMDNFICGNSTFSWWQSYLCQAGSRGSKIVHCGEVFRGKRKQENDITHYYPSNWVKLPI